MNKQQSDLMASTHKLWNPIPRKMNKTDDTNANLVASLLGNILEAACPSKIDSSDRYKHPQGNSFRSLAHNFQQNQNSFNTNTSTISLDKVNSENSSTSCMYDVDIQSAKVEPSFEPLQCKPQIFKTVSQVQTNNNTGFQSQSEGTLKKSHSTPNTASFDYFSHSQKIFFDSLFSQNIAQKLASKPAECFSSAPSYTTNSLFQNLSIKEMSSMLQHPKKSTGKTDKKKCKKCNCKNSKCLKLYCECLASGEYCGADCGCQGCHNNPENESARSFAISQIVEKNPYAFHNPLSTNSVNIKDSMTNSKIFRSKGCTCKKSGCNKKYCECFAAGISCSDHCRCDNCKNCNGTRQKDSTEFSDSSFHCSMEEELGERSIPVSNLDVVTRELSNLPTRENFIHLTPSHIMNARKDNFEMINLKGSVGEQDIGEDPKNTKTRHAQNESHANTLNKLSSYNKENLLKN